MILVEITVPSTDGTYEFKLNEDVLVSMVIDELCSVISEKERCDMPANADSFVLFSADKGVMLSKTLTLYENGVINGDRLILI